MKIPKIACGKSPILQNKNPLQASTKTYNLVSD
jgi:hypothetical protein